MNLNRALVIGYLTQDPEMRYSATGTPICTFTIATNFSRKDAGGERQPETEFHQCIAFGDVGERIAEFMAKGSHLCVEGRLRTEKWDHGDHKHYRTRIVVERATFGAKKDRSAIEDSLGSPEQPTAAAAEPEDDIPF